MNPDDEITARIVDGWFEGRAVPIDTKLVQAPDKYVRADVLPQVLSAFMAAREDGISVSVRSAFRTYDEQKALHDGWKARKPGFKPADPPGFSAHQRGDALDLEFGTLEQRERFAAIAAAHGFSRPTPEPWHFVVTTEQEDDPT